MLVNLQDVLKIAEAKKCAVGSFNTPNLVSLKAVIRAAEELGEPVVISHAQLHEEMGLCTLEEIAPIMMLYAERAKVPVCTHLDHGTDLDYIKRSLELGFTSVMYDGTDLGEEMNTVNTGIVVKMAKKYAASVEGEIGSMGTREDGTGVSLSDDESIYTDPEAAGRFAEETGIDALACAFGTVHGFYVKEPRLDFERLSAIQNRVAVPLVMHGGSGVSEADFEKVISLGIRKINYYTYMAQAGKIAVENMEPTKFYHDIEVTAEEAIRADVKKAMCVFARR